MKVSPTVSSTIDLSRWFCSLADMLALGLRLTAPSNCSSVGYMASLGLHPVPTTGSAKYTERLRKVYLGGVHTESPVFLPSGCKK
jgi:hypothetical protein